MPGNRLETYQGFVYLAAIASGLAVGITVPPWANTLQILIWPTLGVLLYTVFTQVPMTGLRRAPRDGRFFTAIVGGNFVALPVVVWGLTLLVPHEGGVRLGALMVLLVPCTDWFITFTRLGGGETTRAVLFAPVSLLLQMILLPLYLWLFLGTDGIVTLAGREMLLAFLGVVVLPLALAMLTQTRQRRRGRAWEFPARLPIPLLAAVMFLVAASQIEMVRDGMSLQLLANLLLVFGAFLVAAGLLARVTAAALRLEPAEGRVLAFSFGTRNSFVVLPLALALPGGLELAAVAIVLQSLVELFGMVGYLWWVPSVLFPGPAARAS